MSSDYRVMNGEVPFENIKEKKKEYYENHLSVEHPRAKNHYRILSKKCEKQRFGNVAYNKKCAYCGVPSYINDINNYEIDHFKNQSHNEDLDCVNKIDNLVYACHDCNRAKSSFDFPKEYEKILDPDSDTVKEVFFCDSDLSVKITEKYAEDDLVILYYNTMKFGNERRKLDRILVSLKIEINRNPNDELEGVYRRLLEKRNEILF